MQCFHKVQQLFCSINPAMLPKTGGFNIKFTIYKVIKVPTFRHLTRANTRNAKFNSTQHTCFVSLISPVFLN